MSNSDTENPNADQIKFWNGAGGEQWAANQERMDANLRSFTEAAISLAAPASGESALDIGCGCGDTTLVLSDLVGLDGHAMGLDISEPMIARARDRAAAVETMGLPSPRFAIGDASAWQFKSANYDLLFSRFGVMFFSDPTSAFANMRTALRPGGRMAFVCWQPMKENDFFLVPTMAALTVLPAPQAPLPNAPGPFAFGDKDRLNGILKGAGFANIDISSLELEMEVAGGKGVEEAGEELVNVGPIARLVEGISDDQRKDVKAAVIDALRPHAASGSVKLGTKTWLVSAQNA